MKIFIQGIFLVLIGLRVFAQTDSKIELKRDAFTQKYRFNNTLISSAAGLEYPIRTSKNPEAIYEYIQYLKYQKAIKKYALIPAGISFFSFITNNRLTKNQYLTMIGISGVITFYFNQKSYHHLNVSIEKYNLGIDKKAEGIKTLGLNVKYNF